MEFGCEERGKMDGEGEEFVGVVGVEDGMKEWVVLEGRV